MQVVPSLMIKATRERVKLDKFVMASFPSYTFEPITKLKPVIVKAFGKICIGGDHLPETLITYDNLTFGPKSFSK